MVLQLKLSMALVVLFLIGSVFSQIEFSKLPTLRLEKQNTEGSLPLYAPNICPENQLLYTGSQKHEWICDCGPGYLYYKSKDECYGAFRQGPCENGEHLVLRKEDVVPNCIPNPCEDGFAKYEDKCYELGKPNGPCRPILEGGGLFDVNVTTLKVECLKGTDRLSLFSLPNRCTPGSKRDGNGNCRVVYND